MSPHTTGTKARTTTKSFQTGGRIVEFIVGEGVGLHCSKLKKQKELRGALQVVLASGGWDVGWVGKRWNACQRPCGLLFNVFEPVGSAVTTMSWWLASDLNIIDFQPLKDCTRSNIGCAPRAGDRPRSGWLRVRRQLPPEPHPEGH